MGETMVREEKLKALEAAISQVEKQFGKGLHLFLEKEFVRWVVNDLFDILNAILHQI